MLAIEEPALSPGFPFLRNVSQLPEWKAYFLSGDQKVTHYTLLCIFLSNCEWMENVIQQL